MNLKFDKVHLHNFLSFGDVEVDLKDQSYTLVSGINNCKLDNAKSNGSGKSSLWESVVWALTGETIRGTKDVINKFGLDGTFVEITFTIDKDDYKIIRYKEYSNIGTNLKVYINGVDKSGKGIRDTEKLLEQYLPDLNSSLIGSVIILGQGLPQRFTNNTPSGRKEVLEKLSKSDFMIEDIKNKLSDRKVYLSQQLREYEDKVLSDNSKLPIFEKQLEDLEQQLELLSKEDYDQPISKLNEDIDKISNDLSDLEKDITERSVKVESYKLTYDSLKNTLEKKKSELIFSFNKEMNPIVTEHSELKAKVDSLKKEINRLESIKDVCPTCGQKLPDVHKVDTTNLRNELKEVEDKLTQNEELKKVKEDEQNKIYDTLVNDYIKQIEEAEQNKLKELGIYNDLVYNKTCLTNDLNSNKTELEKLKVKKETYINRIETTKNSIKSTESDIKTVKDNLLYNNIEKDNIKSRLDVVNKMLTIATRDFRGFLLSEVINFIDQKAKEYCKEIFNTEEIEFKLDGNNIFIGYCGKQYENLSGGEKQKIDLIVQFSIRDMLSQYLNFSSNILVLDEIFDGLDLVGCQNVLNLISNKLIDIDSIFIITHHTTDLMIPYDKELLIVKDDNGISRIG